MTHTQSAIDIDNSTVKAVCSSYDVPPNFADGALRMYAGDDYDRNIKSMEEFRARVTVTCPCFLSTPLPPTTGDANWCSS